MAKRDVMSFIEGNTTATRNKPALRPTTQAQVRGLYEGLPPRAQERIMPKVEQELTRMAQARFKKTGQLGLGHRETAAALIKEVRRQARPQGAVPDLLRAANQPRKALYAWQDLPERYRSRVGFEVHTAKMAGATSLEQAKVARAAVDRLSQRQAIRDLGGTPPKIRMFTGILGPMSLASEVLGYIADRKEGRMYAEPTDFDKVGIRSRKIPPVRAPKT